MQQAAMAIKLIVQIIDGNAQILQKTKTVIIAVIVARIHTVDRYRMIGLLHFPGNRYQMVYVVKVSDKKKIHSSRTDPKKLGVDWVHAELSVVAQQLLESCNPGAQVVGGNVGIFFTMVLQ